MARKWFVNPDTAMIPLGEGDWIEVKKKLTLGEERDAMRLLYKPVNGMQMPDLGMVGISDVMAYLVDWSIMRDDKKVDISTDGKRLDALRSLAPEAFDVIHAAVNTNIVQMTAVRDA
jgi:hypothetical protein